MVVVVVVGIVGFGDDVGPCRRDPAALHRLERQRPPVEAEAGERGTDGLRVGAGVDERAEEHVAGDPGRRVDVGDPGHGSIRAIAHAAP
jgi:hypothetical protein